VTSDGHGRRPSAQSLIAEYFFLGVRPKQVVILVVILNTIGARRGSALAAPSLAADR
jgi:hypothetical protein